MKLEKPKWLNGVLQEDWSFFAQELNRPEGWNNVVVKTRTAEDFATLVHLSCTHYSYSAFNSLVYRDVYRRVCQERPAVAAKGIGIALQHQLASHEKAPKDFMDSFRFISLICNELFCDAPNQTARKVVPDFNATAHFLLNCQSLPASSFQPVQEKGRCHDEVLRR